MIDYIEMTHYTIFTSYLFWSHRRLFLFGSRVLTGQHLCYHKQEQAVYIWPSYPALAGKVDVDDSQKTLLLGQIHMTWTGNFTKPDFIEIVYSHWNPNKNVKVKELGHFLELVLSLEVNVNPDTWFRVYQNLLSKMLLYYNFLF